MGHRKVEDSELNSGQYFLNFFSQVNAKKLREQDTAKKLRFCGDGDGDVFRHDVVFFVSQWVSTSNKTLNTATFLRSKRHIYFMIFKH